MSPQRTPARSHDWTPLVDHRFKHPPPTPARRIAAWIQDPARGLRGASRWYNAWFTLITITVLLPPASFFALLWWLSFVSKQDPPAGTQLKDLFDASAFAFAVLLVFSQTALSRAQATPAVYFHKARRYRHVADALVRASLAMLGSSAYGLLAKAKLQGLFKAADGDWLYQIWKWLADVSNTASLTLGLFSLVFILMAAYQYLRILFQEMDAGETV